MLTFFHGWRRKIGVLTLLLACVLAMGWVRSLSIRDDINCRKDSQNIYHFQSNLSRMSWVRWREQHPFQMQYFKAVNSSRSSSVDFFEDNEVKWRWHFCGFEFGKLIQSGSGMEMEGWYLPYWSIVTPLTLLAAYLLSKPRVAKRAAVTEN